MRCSKMQMREMILTQGPGMQVQVQDSRTEHGQTQLDT